MESYILTAICLVAFVGAVAVFRFLMEDPELGTIIGALAGLLLAVAAGGAYYVHLASCGACP